MSDSVIIPPPIPASEEASKEPDQPLEAPPALRADRYKNNGRRVTHAVYEGLWEAFRDGTRHKNQLARLFHVSWETVSRLVEQGNPELKWPALRDRLLKHEAEVARLAQARSLEQQREQQDDWYKAKKDNLALARASKAAIALVAQKAIQAARDCTWSKTRRVTDKAGNVTEVPQPANGYDLTAALARMAMAIDTIGKHESFWMGGPTDRKEVIVGSAERVLGLTEAQQQYILDNDGRLPPDLPEDQLWGTAGIGDPDPNN